MNKRFTSIALTLAMLASCSMFAGASDTDNSLTESNGSTGASTTFNLQVADAYTVTFSKNVAISSSTGESAFAVGATGKIASNQKLDVTSDDITTGQITLTDTASSATITADFYDGATTPVKLTGATLASFVNAAAPGADVAMVEAVDKKNVTKIKTTDDVANITSGTYTKQITIKCALANKA